MKCLEAKGKCQWYAYCSYVVICDVSLMNLKWLSGKVEKTIREDQNIKMTDIRNKVGRKWNIGVFRFIAFRAKTMASIHADSSFQE